MGFEMGVEPVENDARLHRRPPRLNVEGQNAVEVLADVDDQGFPNCLAALRGASATGQHGNSFFAGNVNSANNICR